MAISEGMNFIIQSQNIFIALLIPRWCFFFTYYKTGREPYPDIVPQNVIEQSEPADNEEQLDDDIMVELSSSESDHGTADETEHVAAAAMSPCQQFIEMLRKDEFGVNVELNETGRRLMDKQQERLGRSLDRLSADLYSKDTHFVLELIQNADDNDYDSSMLG